MAAVMQSKASTAVRASFGRTSVPSVRRNICVSAAARQVWYPGNDAPKHLDGTLAGDYGFDPLSLGSEPETLRWYVQAELVHCRTAMTAVAGILFTAIGAEAGLGFPQWFDAGKVAIERSPIPFGTLLAVQLILCHWVETKRWADFKNPGSQAQGVFDGSFQGFVEPLKGKENGYPGGPWFDPLGMANGSEEQYKRYKTAEVKNGRLAMVALVGFTSQYFATGQGPIQNLLAHVADPYHVTFATNGVSLPFVGGWK